MRERQLSICRIVHTWEVIVGKQCTDVIPGKFVLMNVPAGIAKPSPNIGNLFGRMGLNMMVTCDDAFAA